MLILKKTDWVGDEDCNIDHVDEKEVPSAPCVLKYPIVPECPRAGYKAISV